MADKICGKVFGIGLTRTGTTSLCQALNLLEIPTIHFPSDATTLDELKAGNFNLSILNSFQGAVDISVAPYYAQLDQGFRGSKFILTIRPLEDWLQAVQKHWAYGERWTGAEYPFIEFIRTAVYGTVSFHRERFHFVYETHIRNVRDYFSNRPSDLLILDICSGDGWEKLCPFLSVPVPDASFPHLNNSVENVKWVQALESAVNNFRAAHAGVNFLVVGNGKLGLKLPGTAPIENRNGLDWGTPFDDRAVIDEVKQLRDKGIRLLVFFFPFFWWFTSYGNFRHYLQNHSRCLAENDQFKLFELH